MTNQSEHPPLELMFPIAAEIARQRWDDEADAYNKWPELGQDEKDELVKQVILEHLDKWKGRI